MRYGPPTPIIDAERIKNDDINSVLVQRKIHAIKTAIQKTTDYISECHIKMMSQEHENRT